MIMIMIRIMGSTVIVPVLTYFSYGASCILGIYSLCNHLGFCLFVYSDDCLGPTCVPRQWDSGKVDSPQPLESDYNEFLPAGVVSWANDFPTPGSYPGVGVPSG